MEISSLLMIEVWLQKVLAELSYMTVMEEE